MCKHPHPEKAQNLEPAGLVTGILDKRFSPCYCVVRWGAMIGCYDLLSSVELFVLIFLCFPRHHPSSCQILFPAHSHIQKTCYPLPAARSSALLPIHKESPMSLLCPAVYWLGVQACLTAKSFASGHLCLCLNCSLSNFII